MVILIVYKFKKIMGSFEKIIIRHKRMGYDLNHVMRQYACLVMNPITVDNFAALFYCTLSDSMMTPTYSYSFYLVVRPELFRLLLGPPGLK